MANHTGKILTPTDENIRLCAEVLGRGEIVGMPTETVYGLAGIAFSGQALTRIFEAKERPTFDPLIIHVSSLEMGYQRLIDEKALSPLAKKRVEALAATFWPGPLTLVLPKHRDVPDLATSGLSTVAVRMPRHPVAQALIRATGAPLAAPSANRFGRISPTSAQDVFKELGDRIDFILDGGRCEIGLESTVISIAPNGDLSLLRPGGTPVEQIKEITHTPIRAPIPNASSTERPLAPGMLQSHYAPKKKLYILPTSLEEFDEALDPLSVKVSSQAVLGLLIFAGDPVQAQAKFSRLTGRAVIARTLSSSGDLQEMGRQLFSEMRFLDDSKADVIFVESIKRPEFERGLGFAIADRLRRASA